MKICVIGTGYVGLVAGAGFADMGNDVTCCDIDAEKIAGLKKGDIPIYEPGLDKLVAHNVAEGRLTFTTDVPSGVAGAEVILLAVGTPPGPDGSADLPFIFKAAEQVGDGADRLGGDRHQVHRAGRHRRQDRSHRSASTRSTSSRWRRTPSSSRRATRSTTS